VAKVSRTVVAVVLAAAVVILAAICIFATPLGNTLLRARNSGKGFAAAVVPAPAAVVQTAPAVSTNGDQTTLVEHDKLDQLYQQGYRYYNDELYQQAIDLENQVIQKDPANYPALTIKGIALCYYGYFDGGDKKNQDFDEGMQDIDRALALKPDYTLALFNKALAYELYGTSSNGYYDTALYWYDRTIATDPQSVWSYYGKAAIYGRRGDVADTCKYLQQAIELNPEVKQDAMQEKDFNNVRNSPEFQSLVGE
jgi:tetratricopeptide (TPR) repeat protein